ncbi:MAG: Gp138 family membrane-puncturing spike protein [Hydrogenophaga sp.]|uniref:Gp138 family membrane-puncturing spike protein n=1 Tax=Hydrogenophaga sp. TaxID=1904254 RepID=UPI0027358C61|nr:Gp138 family membrane-puncturing spike protein [Hydrogenophaga sp.]MDP3351805.1 Gp138 family membrane-puncturing spike protein [Hydrogenophaga sp.]
MDRRERYPDAEEAMRVALEGHQTRIWTALPAIVQTFDPVRMVADVQPTITGIIRNPDGTFGELQLPLLGDCPVVFPGGGGVTLTFPINPGDEVLVVFASRCIDAWWQLGGVQGQAEQRMHDLSDGFVLPQVRSQPRRFTVSTAAAQLRTDDGAVLIELNPDTQGVRVVTPGSAEVQAGGSIELQAPTIRLLGNVEHTGTFVSNGKNIGSTHTHAGSPTAPTGPVSNTGTPV